MANLGGAADAAAAIVNINTMEEYLERTIGVTNQGMRNKLVTNGFTDLDALVRMKESNVEAACHAIRKTTGPAASREVSVVTQKRLEMLVSHVHYMCITKGNLYPGTNETRTNEISFFGSKIHSLSGKNERDPTKKSHSCRVSEPDLQIFVRRMTVEPLPE